MWSMKSPSRFAREFIARTMIGVGILTIGIGAVPNLLQILGQRPIVTTGIGLFGVGVILLLPSLLKANGHAPPATSGDKLGEQWVRDELEFYTRWMQRQAMLFSVFRIVTLLSTAAIPVLAAVKVADAAAWSAVLASVAVVAQGIQAVFKYHENWINGATTRGALDRELALYLAKASPYVALTGSEQENERLLVRQSVAIVNAEYAQWASNLLNSEEKVQSGTHDGGTQGHGGSDKKPV